MKINAENIKNFIISNWFRLTLLILIVIVIAQLFYLNNNLEGWLRAIENSTYDIKDNVSHIEWKLR